jgi:ATP-dependent Clp protease ATP-binding subunit ClpA
MQADSKPEEIDELDRRIIQLKIEREALKKESDKASKDRLKKLEEELKGLESKSADLTGQWKAEKDKTGGRPEVYRGPGQGPHRVRAAPSAKATGPTRLRNQIRHDP